MKAFGRLAAVLVLGLWATAAYGDGGALLLHQDAGPFSISLFAAPQPLTTGMADLSVMVQQRDSGDVLLDAAVGVTAMLEEPGGAQETVHLARGNSSNRLLLSGEVPFAKPGRWRVTVQVHRGNDVAQVSTECTVVPDTSRAAIVWFYVLLPATVILIFLVHQFLKHSQNRRNN